MAAKYAITGGRTYQDVLVLKGRHPEDHGFVAVWMCRDGSYLELRGVGAQPSARREVCVPGAPPSRV